MNNKKHIVILGAGYGGVHAAKLLHKKYKKNDSVEITLIDKNPYHTLMTELHEIAGGRVEKDSVQVDIRRTFHKTKVNVVTDVVSEIDFKNNSLKAELTDYNYDYLILGTGSEPAYFGVKGVQENAFSLWSLEDAIKIREHIKTMFAKASKERNLKKRQAMLTFVVAGAGFTGIEMIGELIDWKKKLCMDYNVAIEDVTLMVVEARDTILPILDDKLAGKAERYLNRKRVQVLKNAPIVESTPTEVVLKDGTRIPTNTLIWTCGVQCCTFAAQSGLKVAKGSCRVITNEFMQPSIEENTFQDNVYVVGDNAYYEETAGKGIPQIVESALQTADTAVKNIVADMENKEKTAFKSNYHGFMVSIGSRYGVANAGGIKSSGFFAIAMKHLINMHYLLGVGGIYLVYKYLCHEFFHIKDKRSIMGGHLSARSSTLFLVVFRMYVGVLWLIEGITKVKDGWLTGDKIYIVKVAGDAASSASTTGAAEAVSSASQGAAAAAAGPVPLLSQPPAFFTSIMDTFVAPYAGFFQACVVLAEIAIGLALIAGLFTFLASLASIFLCLNFILSAMAGKEILWYIFGGIALMAGSGRAFGLDYYVMPWLGSLWDKFRRGKNTPIYAEGNSVNM